MSDIVERLINYRPENEWGDKVHHTICTEASGEISGLRTELRAKEAEAIGYLRAVGELQKRNDDAAGEIQRLRKALEPFRSVSHAILAEAPPIAGSIELFMDCEGNIYRMSLDDLRNICAALDAVKDR